MMIDDDAIGNQSIKETIEENIDDLRLKIE